MAYTNTQSLCEGVDNLTVWENYLVLYNEIGDDE